MKAFVVQARGNSVLDWKCQWQWREDKYDNFFAELYVGNEGERETKNDFQV